MACCICSIPFQKNSFYSMHYSLLCCLSFCKEGKNVVTIACDLPISYTPQHEIEFKLGFMPA